MNDRHMLWLVFYPILWPLSLLYKCIQASRRFLYRVGVLGSIRFPCKVISVGNTLVGGTGKTPVVIEIAKFFKKHNCRVAILTRGYRSGLSQNEGVVLMAGKPVLYIDLKEQSQWVRFSEQGQKRPNADEAFLQSYHLPEVPLIVGVRRAELMQLFLKQDILPQVGREAADKLILDDGLQHLNIQRDLDICLGLADLNWLKDEVMPLGRLRESNGLLNDVDYILLTKAQGGENAKAWLQSSSYHGGVSRIESTGLYKVPGETSLMEECRDFPKSKCILVSAIAMPDSFEKTVASLGVRVQEHKKFADHAVLSVDKLKPIRERGLPVITTEKDFFRHPDLFLEVFESLYVLPIRVTIPSSLELLLAETVG